MQAVLEALIFAIAVELIVYLNGEQTLLYRGSDFADTW